MKKRIFVIASLCLLALLAMAFFYKGTIFQRGNPIPYVIKMFTLNDINHYQKVFTDQDVYITKRYDFEDLKKHIENTYGITFKEQLGGGFLFYSDFDKKDIVVISEIFWKYYSVWEVVLDKG